MYQKVWCMYSWFCQGAKATTTMTQPIAFEFHSKMACCITLFGSFLWCPWCNYYVKLPMSCFVRTWATTSGANLSLFFWTWIQTLRIQLQENSPIFDKLSRGKTDVTKFFFEKGDIHFLWCFLCCRPSGVYLVKLLQV